MQEYLLKDSCATCLRWGLPPPKRPLEEYVRKGIIALDKPAGPTSHKVVEWVKEVTGVENAGHAGTLDPGVSGVLPVGLGRATKVLMALLNADKEYVCVMKLHDDVDKERLLEVCKEFIGEIYQVPPVRSAVKRRVRKRRIYYIDVLEIRGRYVLMRVGCEHGTYIRKLCSDIGDALGCGASMKELRRTRVGPFKEEEGLVTLHELVHAFKRWREEGDEKLVRKVVQPMEKAVEELPKIVVKDTAIEAIAHGAQLAAPGVALVTSDVKPGELTAVLSLKGEIVAFCKPLIPAREILKKTEGVVAKIERVIIERGVYPRVWRRKQKEGDASKT